MDERLEAVRELWSTYREEGVEKAIPLLHPDVEFVDHDGNVFHGHDGVRRFFGTFEQRGEEFAASPYSFELHEPDLLVIGHRRIRTKEARAATISSSCTASTRAACRASPRT